MGCYSRALGGGGAYSTVGVKSRIYGMCFLLRNISNTIKIIIKNIIFLFRFCFIFLLVTVCFAEEREFYGQFISSIKVIHPSNVFLTWSSDDNTNNVTIRYDGSTLLLTDSFSKGVLHLKFDEKKPPSSNSNMISSILVDLSLWFRKRRSVSVDRITNSNEKIINITVPLKYADTLCVNNERCFPIRCQLSFLSDSHFSDIPATNTMLFADKYCTLKKPEFWDQWIKVHFKTDIETEQYIFTDPDKDGLINFLEYHGDTMKFEALSGNRSVVDIGTNPTNADSDGDLLLDGFEFFYKMNPKKKDDINADTDGDGLTNLDEQIRKTNPLKRDSDNDGISDGEEVRRNTNPLNPFDHGEENKNLDTATISLNIGDPSGSHSERYLIRVGSIEHQAPYFGRMSAGQYVFKPGTYKIAVKHIATKLRRPDYDYTATVTKVDGRASVVVSDPSGLLGTHYESITDFTVGKSAELIVATNCAVSGNRSVEMKCECLNSCETCESKAECYWDNTFCTKKPMWQSVKKIAQTCPCTKCFDWYVEEKASDMAWLSDLNRNFKCPCRVTISRSQMKEIDNPSNTTWGQDTFCNPKEPDNCKKYHNGAKGCIRSVDKSKSGAGQQCCYDSSGGILKAGSAGAGTPDKYYVSGFNSKSGFGIWHYMYDVRPYNWCCLECSGKRECNYYVNELRKGSTDHCA